MRKVFGIVFALATLMLLLFAGTSASVSAQPVEVDMGTLLEGDLNNDGRINISDFTEFKTGYPCFSGCVFEDGDFDRSGAINLTDLTIFKGNYPKFTINEV